jgi:hypothetical protein
MRRYVNATQKAEGDVLGDTSALRWDERGLMRSFSWRDSTFDQGRCLPAFGRFDGLCSAPHFGRPST